MIKSKHVENAPDDEDATSMNIRRYFMAKRAARKMKAFLRAAQIRKIHEEFKEGPSPNPYLRSQTADQGNNLFLSPLLKNRASTILEVEDEGTVRNQPKKNPALKLDIHKV